MSNCIPNITKIGFMCNTHTKRERERERGVGTNLFQGQYDKYLQTGKTGCACFVLSDNCQFVYKRLLLKSWQISNSHK